MSHSAAEEKESIGSSFDDSNMISGLNCLFWDIFFIQLSLRPILSFIGIDFTILHNVYWKHPFDVAPDPDQSMTVNLNLRSHDEARLLEVS